MLYPLHHSSTTFHFGWDGPFVWRVKYGRRGVGFGPPQGWTDKADKLGVKGLLFHQPNAGYLDKALIEIKRTNMHRTVERYHSYVVFTCPLPQYLLLQKDSFYRLRKGQEGCFCVLFYY